MLLMGIKVTWPLLFPQVPCSTEPLMDSSLVSVGVLKDFAAALCELGVWTPKRNPECRIPSPGQRVYGRFQIDNPGD